jgi:superfamily II DNA or RNA helicase
MKLTISDQQYLSELSIEQYDNIKQDLTFINPKYSLALNFKRSVKNISKTLELYQDIEEQLIIPRGYSLDTKSFEIHDNRNSHPVTIKSSIETRKYQERAILLALCRDNGVIVAPTGAGKTTMGIEIASRLGQRCLILVKSKDLANQWIKSIKKLTGLDCGIIGDGKYQEGKEFTVALFQTLVKSNVSLDYGLVISDECHNIPAIQAYKVINQQTAKYRYGLTATPQRRDNLEMMIEAALGEIVAEIEVHEVEGAVLPVQIATKFYNFTGNPTSWSEFINILADDTDRNNMIIASAIKSSKGVGTAILTGTVAHAERLHNMLIDNKVSSLLLHGQLPKKQRDQGMLDAPNHQLIIGTLSLLSEGIDWPHIGSIIFAAPVSAEIDREKPAATRLLQSIGRGRRPFPGKLKTFVLDIIDNCPFGNSAYKKRAEIYLLNDFAVQAIS